MSVVITNTGAPNRREAEDPGGLRSYEIRINRDLITSFTHNRRDGLAVCLLKAAEAVADLDPKEAAKLETLKANS